MGNTATQPPKFSWKREDRVPPWKQPRPQPPPRPPVPLRGRVPI